MPTKIGIISKFELSGIYLEKLLAHGGIDAKLFPPLTKIGANPVKIKELTEAIKDFKIIHLISGYQRLKFIMWLKLLGKKIVNHWVGTDVMEAMNKNWDYTVAYFTDTLIDVQLANAPHLVDELKSAGISAQWVPTIPPIYETSLVLGNLSQNSKKKVLLYIPEDRIDFHNGTRLLGLAKIFPDINFEVIDNNGEGLPNLPNIHYNGWVSNMENIWQDISVLIRFPRHDGFPRLVLEALAHEKWVIWNHHLSHCSYVQDIDKIPEILGNLLNKKKPNTEGRKFFFSEFNVSVLSKKYQEIYSCL